MVGQVPSRPTHLDSGNSLTSFVGLCLRPSPNGLPLWGGGRAVPSVAEALEKDLPTLWQHAFDCDPWGGRGRAISGSCVPTRARPAACASSRPSFTITPSPTPPTS